MQKEFHDFYFIWKMINLALLELKKDNNWGAIFAIQLVNASAEFETAWHSIRLSNVPACYRQSRVGLECIGFSILLAIPENELKQLSSKLRLVKQMKKYSDKTLFELFSPKFIKENRTQPILKPKILGNYIIPAFFEASEKIIGIEKPLIENLKIITEHTFHPSSHNSMHNFAYHFEAFSTEKGKAGAMFSEKRSDTLIKAAENLGNLTHILADIMDSTYDYLYELDQ